LREQGCPWDAVYICQCAAYGDNSRCTELLQYMLDAGELTDAALLMEVLLLAGRNNKLAVAKWLRQHGAQWPPKLYRSYDSWRGEVLAWARAEGCTSPAAPPDV
jgi:hypothetical protein